MTSSQLAHSQRYLALRVPCVCSCAVEDKVTAVDDRLRGEEGHGELHGDVANGPLGRIEAKLDALQARVDQKGHLSLMSGRVL